MKSPGVVILFLIFCSSSNLLGQGEGNVWYFGDSCGVDFNSGSPVVLMNSGMPSHEACASISDENGNILFYTNSYTCWNSNHEIMLNGESLSGSPSSSQGALIVQMPGSSSLYYLFTTDGDSGTGLTYSIVDMTLDGDLGGIVSGQKNVIVLPQVTEKLAGVLHQNSTDIWIIVHTQGDDAFYAYLLSSSGLDMTPVITHIGPTVGPAELDCIGYLKASPDGSKLAMANYNVPTYLFDFNTGTGVISNPKILLNDPGVIDSYGIEFSASGRFLYISNPKITEAQIFQFDMNAADVASTIEIITTSTAPFAYAALQRGPDGRIYASDYDSTSLSVIQNPDVAGSACNFVEGAINLNGATASMGLPNYINSVYSQYGAGLSDQQHLSRISVFPNPAENYIEISAPLDSEDEIILINSAGIQLKKQLFGDGKMELTNLEPGVYFICCMIDNRPVKYRFVKI